MKCEERGYACDHPHNVVDFVAIPDSTEWLCKIVEFLCTPYSAIRVERLAVGQIDSLRRLGVRVYQHRRVIGGRILHSYLLYTVFTL